MTVFQYVAVLHPTEAQEEDGVKASLIQDVTTIVASSEKQAVLVAARALDDDVDLDQVELIVRPF